MIRKYLDDLTGATVKRLKTEGDDLQERIDGYSFLGRHLQTHRGYNYREDVDKIKRLEKAHRDAKKTQRATQVGTGVVLGSAAAGGYVTQKALEKKASSNLTIRQLPAFAATGAVGGAAGHLISPHNTEKDSILPSIALGTGVGLSAYGLGRYAPKFVEAVPKLFRNITTPK